MEVTPSVLPPKKCDAYRAVTELKNEPRNRTARNDGSDIFACSMAGAWCCFFSNIRWQDHMLGNKNDYLPGHPIHLHGYVQYIPMMFGIAFMMVGWSYTMTIAWKLTMAYNISSQIPWYAIIVITYPIVSRPIITICHSSFFITMV
jgi:hypothetical protein